MGDHRWKRRSHLSLVIPTRSSALEVGLLSETDGGLKRDWRHVTGDLTCDKGEVFESRSFNSCRPWARGPMHGLSAGKGLVICGIYGLVASTMDNKFYLWGRSSGVT